MKDNVEIISENSSSNDENKLSLTQLIYLLIKNITHEGFKRADNLSVEGKDSIKILDFRETKISGITDLFILLQPKFDEAMKEDTEKFKNKLKELETNFNKASLFDYANEQVNFNPRNRHLDFNEKNKILNEIINNYKDNCYMNINKSSSIYEWYLEKKYEAHQELFERLIFLLEKLNWLRGGTLEDK